MHRLLLLFLSLSLFASDFDCVIIGTSPLPLFEALYQHYSGKRVLIIEQHSTCGGAWQSIDICGIPQADLGCHQIGHDSNLKNFLETHGGCHIVSMDQPDQPYTHTTNGFYFSHGCAELINNLTHWISHTSITLLLNQRVEHIFTTPTQATILTQNYTYTTDKIYYPSYSSFILNDIPPSPHRSKYYHLYLLIADPTPPKFSYRSHSTPGISRVMNLSHFVNLAHTGRHLIVLQTYSDAHFNNPQPLLNDLIQKSLLDPSAYLLNFSSYIYEQEPYTAGRIHSLPASHQSLFEHLNTSAFANLSQHISRWSQTLPPYPK